jgi:23S rRNA (uracil1939-C5)-methyltransferase
MRRNKSPRASPTSSQGHLLEGREFVGTVRDVATNGKAVIEHSSGIAVFIPGAWVGEEIRYQIHTVKKRYALGEIIDVLRPSASRVTPPCLYFSASPGCGGCSWQFIDYLAQLAMKHLWVVRSFARLGCYQIASVQASDAIYGYRNRAEFKSDGNKLGYLSAQSNTLIDIASCPIVNNTVAIHLMDLRSQLPNAQWDSRSKATQSKNSVSRSRHQVNKVVPPLTLLAVDDDLPRHGDFLINKRRPFKQANTGQNDFLRNWLSSVISTQKKTVKVLELFCGSGNFTRVIAAAGFDSIIACEISPQALQCLSAARLERVTALEVDLFSADALRRLCHQQRDAKILVVDPPRDGLVCIEPLLEHPGFQLIAYISCDLATCVRDIEHFLGAGYSVDSVLPVDMFPHTPHIELCTLLSRKTDKND